MKKAHVRADEAHCSIEGRNRYGLTDCVTKIDDIDIQDAVKVGTIQAADFANLGMRLVYRVLKCCAINERKLVRAFSEKP